jgi:protein tyrosine phosphatase (PTP) superfamily phosphohydrolase (DUF442 family)
VGSIRNFAWVEPGVVARGEQPALEASTFDALRDVGVTAILSLRPDGEEPTRSARRPWPTYRVAQEQALASAAGLRFRHLPFEDFSAPPPRKIASALDLLDALVAEQPGVYVHCRAGAGRAGLVSAAWGVARGQSGDDAAANYLHFMEHLGGALGWTSAEEWQAFARRVGQPYVWWALREVVAALGSPVAHDPPRLLPPERPPDADSWDTTYQEALAPWRTKRTA